MKFQILRAVLISTVLLFVQFFELAQAKGWHLKESEHINPSWVEVVKDWVKGLSIATADENVDLRQRALTVRPSKEMPEVVQKEAWTIISEGISYQPVSERQLIILPVQGCQMIYRVGDKDNKVLVSTAIGLVEGQVMAIFLSGDIRESKAVYIGCKNGQLGRKSLFEEMSL